MIASFIFYLFSAVLIASAFMVVAAKNPVHSVLYLILCFFNAAGLFVLMGAEFVAFILIIVYVGAVAVLFLFVVMMLDIDFERLKGGFLSYVPLGLMVSGIILSEIILASYNWKIGSFTAVHADTSVGFTENTRAIGRVLYTDYFYAFQVSGLILLVAMIGAIVLTLRDRKTALRQNVTTQLDRRPEDAVKIEKVEIGKGVDL